MKFNLLNKKIIGDNQKWKFKIIRNILYEYQIINDNSALYPSSHPKNIFYLLLTNMRKIEL